MSYQQIAEMFVNALKAGTIPWRKPWNSMLQANVISGKPYRGINQLWLSYRASEKSYKSPLWVTSNQIKQYHAWIKKGEKGTIIVKWFWLNLDKETGQKIDEKELENYDPAGIKKIGRVTYHTVFNLDQLSTLGGLATMEKRHAPKLEPTKRSAGLASLLESYKDKPEIRSGGNIAGYIPSGDYILMPVVETFASSGEYAKVLAHELAHSTAHESRLNRPIQNTFGSPAYAREELVAEIAAIMVLQAIGEYDQSLFDNSTSYVQSWLATLENDYSLIAIAAQGAQKAADYMLTNKV